MGDAGFRPPEVLMRFRILAATMILTLAAACSDRLTEVERDPTSVASAGTVAFATAASPHIRDDIARVPSAIWHITSKN
jgi:hypothetical protein